MVLSTFNAFLRSFRSSTHNIIGEIICVIIDNMHIIAALFFLLLSMAQLGSPEECLRCRDFSKRPYKNYKGMRDSRYGTFAVHDQIQCEIETLIQEDMYGGCMNILDTDNGKSFYWRASHYYHLVYGMMHSKAK